MSYRLKEIKEKLSASVYAIYFFDVEFSKLDIESVKNTLRRYKKKFPYMGFLLVISNTDSNHCTIRKIMLKKHIGSPPSIVLGHKIQTHIHLAIIGDNNHSAWSVTNQIVKTLNKRFDDRVRFRGKGRDIHAKNFIKYSLKQANHVWKKGKFEEIIYKEKTIKTKKI